MIRQLTKDEYLKTFCEPMRNVTGIEDAVCDVWPYAYKAIAADLPKCDASATDVEFVYRTGDGKFEHILIPVSQKNVYLVLVISLESKSIFGHLVLDLNHEYGIQSNASK